MAPQQAAQQATGAQYDRVPPGARTVYVPLSGTLDIYAMERAREVMRRVHADRVVIDLSAVRLVSAAFIGEVVRLKKRLPHARIELVGANANVQRILGLLRVNEVLD